MNRMPEPVRALARRCLAGVALLCGLVAGSALAQGDPPARVATLTQAQGSVAWAPAGDSEWLAATRNRPLTRGDRLWVDEGSRAELHLGSAALQLDSLSLVQIAEVDGAAVQATLSQGSAAARVRELAHGENFELDTPQLALRVLQPGEFRVDVDLQRQLTRVTVRSGLAVIYGAHGDSREMAGGEQLAFSGRDLAVALGVASLAEDDFDRWCDERNRAEDRSQAARYLPRGVVGYAELDRYGHWATDTTWGPVWYPTVTVVDWAPYRFGHWEWIPPWGWTWIDDAPWGFAPFHYGRWVQVGPRWAWVPGRLPPRPVYAPALVAFVGGAGWSLTLSAGPGIAWYPLAPWEPWQPWYRASPIYLQQVNRVVVVQPAPARFQRPPGWFTAMPLHAFERGQAVPDHRARVEPARLLQAPVAVPPVLPEGRQFAAGVQRPVPLRAAPPAAQALPATVAVNPPPPAVPRRFVPAPAPRAALPPSPRGAAAPTRPGAAAQVEREPSPAAGRAPDAAPRPGHEPQRPVPAQQRAAEDARAQVQQRAAQQEQQRAAQQAQERAAQQARDQAQRAAQEQQRAAQAQQRAAREAHEQLQRATQEQQRAAQAQQRAVQAQQRALQEQQRQPQREQPPAVPQRPPGSVQAPAAQAPQAAAERPPKPPRREEPGRAEDERNRRP